MTVWRIFSFLILVTPLFCLILGLICWRYPPKGPDVYKRQLKTNFTGNWVLCSVKMPAVRVKTTLHST